MDRLLKLSLIVGILVSSFTVAYYFIVYLPERDRQSRASLEMCLQEAEAWAIEANLKYLEDNTYTAQVGEGIDRIRKEKREDCFKRFPQK